MGRPATKPTKLRDGFYIEVRNKGSRSGIRIRRDSERDMLSAIKEYERVKDVVVLGEFKNGKNVNDK
jgi:metallophosphoesterase superfamily enzyme